MRQKIATGGAYPNIQSALGFPKDVYECLHLHVRGGFSLKLISKHHKLAEDSLFSRDDNQQLFREL